MGADRLDSNVSPPLRADHNISGLSGGFKKALGLLLFVYQKFVSPLLGPRCRFYPSCSHYAQECLSQYGIGTATKKITFRLLRCHPFHPGGVDLP